MKRFYRHSPGRIAFASGLLLTGLLSAVPASAADPAVSSEAGASCREEARRVPLFQQGGNPKLHPLPRYENRLVKICDGQIVSQTVQRHPSKEEKG